MKTKIKGIWTTAWIASLLLALLIGGCKKDTYVEVVGVCPVVKSTNPANMATLVPLNQVIMVTFNEDMNPTTITADCFTLTGTANVPGTLTYDALSATMSFVPTSNLEINTTYSGRVNATVKDMKGNVLQTAYNWTFSTGAILSPIVVSTDPERNATGIVLNKTVSATYSMPMDPMTINDTTFIVRKGTVIIPGVVTYYGLTANFHPLVAFEPVTVYTATISSQMKNMAGEKLQGAYKWSFTTGSITAPEVIYTNPADFVTGEVLNPTVTATFSEAMNPLTINASTFTLKQGNDVQTGTVSYTGTTASFTPAIALKANSIYSAIITAGAKNLAGTPLANDYVWIFTTGEYLAPLVTATNPLNNAVGIGIGKVVNATFNIAMSPASFNDSTFIVRKNNLAIAGSVSMIGNVAYFSPNAPLAINSIYTCTLTTKARSTAGIPMQDNYSWTFTTAAALTYPTIIASDPKDNENNVVLTKNLTATFSEAMDYTTLTPATFLLKNGSSSVAGTVSYVNKVATFAPIDYLLPSTTYTATITTGAKSISGMPLATDYTWSFSTPTPITYPNVNLNSVARFGIISGVGVSNNAGFSIINNLDVGISPGHRSSITGFPPATITNGAIYASDDISPPGVAAMLAQAILDLNAAYLFAEGATSPAPATVSGDQGGKTLAPGIYKSTSTLLIQSGDLTLDAGGNSNAVWIFQIPSGFTTVGGAGGNVILSGGAQAKNVFWQVGSSATIGDYTSFNGNVLALTSITMNSHSVATGRMLAINGSVILTHTNTINKP